MRNKTHRKLIEDGELIEEFIIKNLENKRVEEKEKGKNMENYGAFSRKTIVKFTGTDIRELEDFPFSEAGKFKIIPCENKELQLKIDDKQYLVKGEYLLRENNNGNYKVLIEKQPLVELLEEYQTENFPKDFLFKITELL